MSTRKSSAIWVVTVTYGDRFPFISRVFGAIDACQDVAGIIVVNNGSKNDLHTLESERISVRVVVHESNVGSAIAFGKGIEAAISEGAAYVLLLDDDNVPSADCILNLKNELISLERKFSDKLVAVSATRNALADGRRKDIPSSFLGFDATERISEFFRMATPPIEDTSRIVLPFAPYGGLLTSAKVLGSIGLPKRDLILYADDTEFTYRITKLGGIIHQISDAVIEDVDRSWNLEGQQDERGLVRLLTQGSDFRVYYSTRNRCWFDCRHFANSKIKVMINVVIYVTYISFLAARMRKFKRLKLILIAIRDGMFGRLGVNPVYSLP